MNRRLNPPGALMIAGASSNSGKTIVALGIIAALRARGLTVRAIKCGPDYIDPMFLAAASGAPAINLDPWAMSGDRIADLHHRHLADADFLVVEGVMGMLDGGPMGAGSTLDLARLLQCPVLLVINGASLAQSAAAVAEGFCRLAADVHLIGAVVNSVASERHANLIAEGFERASVPLLGGLRRDPRLKIQSRHLGLVQALEHEDLAAILDAAGERIEIDTDFDSIISSARTPIADKDTRRPAGMPPIGDHIAVANDAAFAFAYQHLLDDWRRAGATISFFSPLADEAPTAGADAIYLPGGYPELHGAGLAAADQFHAAMRAAADAGARIYGECGGYMVLGESLTDAEGRDHKMLGLLPLATGFHKRKLMLGYRTLRSLNGSPFPDRLSAHEFHYATIRSEGDGDRLFQAADLNGSDLGPVGLRRGNISGSFAHIIDMIE